MSDRLCIVTGASGGIGKACVQHLQQSGTHVLGVDVAPVSTADEHLTLDLGDPDCGEAIASHLNGRPVWGLVNNAAVALYKTVGETSLEDWDRVLSTNLRAPFFIVQSLISHLEDGRGSVVNISSVHAVATSEGIAAYAASKGGLVALTRAMALELAELGIRVNAVIPGAVETSMLMDGLWRSGMTTDDLASRHPIGRVIHPDEIAMAVSFLLGSGASGITGSLLTVDGGALARISTE